MEAGKKEQGAEGGEKTGMPENLKNGISSNTTTGDMNSHDPKL